MPINEAAINAYLARAPAKPPLVKGLPPADLRAMIVRQTGMAYAPLTEPRPAQLEGLAFALTLRRALLFYGMRMGKSKIALDWAAHLKAAGLWHGKGLIIAHAPIGLDVWEGEARRHSTLRLASIRSGPQAGFQLVDALVNEQVDLIVMSWSSLQNVFGVKRLNRKQEVKLYPDQDALIDAAEFFKLVIIDEIHLVKNHQSLWFRMAKLLVENCVFRLGLTGTPIGRDPYAVWSQAFLIEPYALGGSYHFFEAAFGNEVDIYAPGRRKIKGFKFNKELLPILQDRLDSIALAARLEGSEIHSGEVELKMLPAQIKAYNEVLENVIEQASSLDDQQKINAFVRMRQISSGFLPFVSDDGEERVVRFPSAKLAWLDELLTVMADDIQMIIFHEFILSGDGITALLKKHKLAHGWLYGGAKNKAQIIKDFQTGKTRILVANTAAGGMAIDLPQADYMLFYESPVAPITRQQAEARPLGRGAKPLVIDDLICSPIDRKVLGFVKEGKEALNSLIHDKRGWKLLRAR